MKFMESDYNNKLPTINYLRSNSQVLDEESYGLLLAEFQGMTRLLFEVRGKKEIITKYNQYFLELNLLKSVVRKNDSEYERVLSYRKTTSQWERDINGIFNSYLEHSKKINDILDANQIYSLEPKIIIREAQVFRRKVERTIKINNLQISESFKGYSDSDVIVNGEHQKILLVLQDLLKKIEQNLESLKTAESRLKSLLGNTKEQVIIGPKHSAHAEVQNIKKHGIQIQTYIKRFNEMNLSLAK